MTQAEIDALNVAIELEVFGDDLSCWDKEGQERAKRCCEAIQSGLPGDYVQRGPLDFIGRAIWNGTEYNPEISYPWPNPGQAYWYIREGKPWQSDLEAHVAAYRAEPRNFAGDIGLAMTLLWPKLPPGTTLQYSDTLAPTHIVTCNGKYYLCSGINKTPAGAICRAVLAVVRDGANVDNVPLTLAHVPGLEEE